MTSQAPSPAKQFKQALAHFHPSLAHSWFYAEPEFKQALDTFLQHGEQFDQAEVIWKIGTRCVWKVTLPEALGGKTIALKRYEGRKQLRYAVHPSKTAIEAANYWLFQKLGLKMARLAFVGDVRTCFYLKRSYIATEFVEDSQDGRAFSPGADMDKTPEQRSFIQQVLTGLAKLHALHCFHRGAHVYNFLWKPTGNGNVQTTGIDVASCRFKTMSEESFTPFIVKDLADFFRDLELTQQQLGDVLDRYRKQNPNCQLTTTELLKNVSAKAQELKDNRRRAKAPQTTAQQHG